MFPCHRVRKAATVRCRSRRRLDREFRLRCRQGPHRPTSPTTGPGSAGTNGRPRQGRRHGGGYRTPADMNESRSPPGPARYPCDLRKGAPPGQILEGEARRCDVVGDGGRFAFVSAGVAVRAVAMSQDELRSCGGVVLLPGGRAHATAGGADAPRVVLIEYGWLGRPRSHLSPAGRGCGRRPEPPGRSWRGPPTPLPGGARARERREWFHVLSSRPATSLRGCGHCDKSVKLGARARPRGAGTRQGEVRA